MNILIFIKRNFIKIAIQILFVAIMLISFVSNKFSIDLLKNDSKTVNYAGILRGGTQRLIKQELQNRPNQQLINELDKIIYDMKINSKDNHFTIKEEAKLQNLLSDVELKWIKMKDEIYKFRISGDSQKLYELSEEYYKLTNSFVFEIQEYVENKVEKIAILQQRMLISIIIILVFNIYQFISKINVQNKNSDLSNLAYKDSLTGLFNRAYCNTIINKYNQMETLPDLACIYIDLNDLKITNDLLGHEAGDKFLRDFSSIFKEASEPYGLACRNGGDEFVAIFENCTQKNISDYINHMNEKTAAYNLKEKEIHISFAIGVAYSDEITTNRINDLLTLADKRMYENKAEYKKNKIEKLIVNEV